MTARNGLWLCSLTRAAVCVCVGVIENKQKQKRFQYYYCFVASFSVIITLNFRIIRVHTQFDGVPRRQYRSLMHTHVTTCIVFMGARRNHLRFHMKCKMTFDVMEPPPKQTINTCTDAMSRP